MARSRRSYGVTDYSSVLNRSGDVSVGAYARAQRRRRIAVAAAGILLVLGAVWLHGLLQPRDGNDQPEEHTVLVRCVLCEHEFGIPVPSGPAAFPLTCPECGERACHKLWECRVCRHRFVLMGGDSRELQCPNCGSRAVGAATPPDTPPGPD